ncbi:tRNA1(Val) (adenine(37)-N6)-methyltransferase [Puniceibacterium sediminis]|uniref:tRNA1(Val) A37 N6-methylase TrmN6 n=1 Tax=Puniceibacterium sediminis TaxID=1608407 RepID=A0A238VJT6_9RHOB|nr:methyltransferase domain-containing protein [Puniceibacterium sediminis]SNR34635.1 tRNA1(Val) A37 N6-methylase TrmN6 [Puniceibacterium sediminis]
MQAQTFPDEMLSCDAFLGGKLKLFQPKQAYRAGIDPVLLAASVPARSGDSVLDLGCGAGAALLCLGARVPGLRLWGAELQPGYAALAARNAALNGLTAEIVTADLNILPPPLSQMQFNHVIANPPYFDPLRRTSARDPGRETGLAEGRPLGEWVGVAARRTAPGGTVTMIQSAERLPDLAAAMVAHLGSVQLWPLAPRTGRDPRLILVRGRKAGRAVFRLHAPLILHEGAHHSGDVESYVPLIRAVLRDGAALPFPAHG